MYPNERNETSEQRLIIVIVPINAFSGKVRKESAFLRYSVELQEEGKETEQQQVKKHLLEKLFLRVIRFCRI